MAPSPCLYDYNILSTVSSPDILAFTLVVVVGYVSILYPFNSLAHRKLHCELQKHMWLCTLWRNLAKSMLLTILGRFRHRFGTIRS